MEEEGTRGWVWGPDIKLVRDSDDITIELDLSVRIFSGRFEAEYAWVYKHPEELGIAQFRDWADVSDNDATMQPVYSPQWRSNGQGGAVIGDEVGHGARLITPEDRDYEYAKALLEAAYELDD